MKEIKEEKIMKKIMKKAFSLMLALVMVLSLAPMTAMAAENELDVTAPWEVMANCLEEPQYYIYEATEDGTVTVDVTTVFGQIGCTIVAYGDTSFSNVQKLMTAAETLTFDVKAGAVYEVKFEGLSGDTQMVVFKSSFSAGSEEGGAVTGGTSLENAIDLTANKSINIASNGTTFYKVAMLDSSKTYNVTVTNNEMGPMAGAQQIGVTAYYMGAADGETVYNVGEATAVVRPAMDGTIYFSVENAFMYGDLNAVVSVAEVTEGGEGGEGGEGDEGGSTTTTGTYENPAELTGGIQTATIANGEMYYYAFTAPTAGRLWVEVAPNVTGWTYDIYINGSYMDYIDGAAVTGKEDIIVAEGDVVLLGFASSSPSASIPFETSFEEGTFTKLPNGKESAPYIMAIGDNSVTVPAGTAIWYKYVATADGTLALTMKTDESSNGWFYDGYVNEYDYSYFPANPETYFGNASTDTDPASLRTLELRAGDVVMFMVMTAFDENYERPAGTVVFNAWFTAGEVNTDEKDEYTVSDTVLALGENAVELDPSAETTVFEFCPEEAGTYVFETDNGVLGYWGAGSFFVTDYTGEEKEATLEYSIENVGPSIMVGVTGEGEANITIKLAGEAEKKPTTPTILYSNVVVPEYLDIYDEVTLDNIVSITDGVKDTAVLGADGYYHLNSATGPVLFVNLDSSTMSLTAAYSYGQLNGAKYDADDNLLAIIDYNTAFEAYYAESSDASCYPLTEDLMTILKEVGANQNWYGENGYVGGEYADEAWMFACCYSEDLTSMEDEIVEAEEEPVNVVIKDSGVLTEEALDAIIDATEGENVVFTVPVGENDVTFEFEADSLELIDGKETYDFSVELIDDYDVATEDEADIEEDGFVLRVNFSYEGKLPATATITIPVGADYKNTTLYYYQIMADGTLKYVCDAPVDANGNAKVTQDHCSDYVLLSEKVVDVPNTGDSTNVALWFAVLALGVAAIAGSVVMRKREF